MATETEMDEDQPVTCPKCQGTGGVDVGVGNISCGLCDNSGETTYAKAEEFSKGLEMFGDLFR